MESVEPTNQSEAQSDEYACEFDVTLIGRGVKLYKNTQLVEFVRDWEFYLLTEHLVVSNSSFALTGIPAVNKNNERLNEDEVRLIFRLEIKSRTAFEGN